MLAGESDETERATDSPVSQESLLPNTTPGVRGKGPVVPGPRDFA